MNWIQIKDLKCEYKKFQNEARKARTKKTREKYLDLALGVKRRISNELFEWNFDGLDFKPFNIIEPLGGPYCLVNASEFKIEKNYGGVLQVSFNYGGERFAGYLHWIDDKCGIDNMSKID